MELVENEMPLCRWRKSGTGRKGEKLGYREVEKVRKYSKRSWFSSVVELVGNERTCSRKRGAGRNWKDRGLLEVLLDRSGRKWDYWNWSCQEIKGTEVIGIGTGGKWEELQGYWKWNWMNVERTGSTGSGAGRKWKKLGLLELGLVGNERNWVYLKLSW